VSGHVEMLEHYLANALACLTEPCPAGDRESARDWIRRAMELLPQHAAEEPPGER
jgi:hypothetical protein